MACSLIVTSQSECTKALVTITHVENGEVFIGTEFLLTAQ